MFFDEELLEPLFLALEATRGVTQSPVYHPEGDVFIHSVQTMDWAFRETIDVDSILAAMLHDIGKINGSHGHENYAIEIIGDHLSVKTAWLIEQHMRYWNLVMGDMRRLAKVHYLLDHPWLRELTALCRWDKLGRNPHKVPVYERGNIIERLNNAGVKHFGKPIEANP